MDVTISNDPVEDMDYDPWTKQEMEMLASAAADLLESDGFDEPGDS